jgi:hypothetical protein
MSLLKDAFVYFAKFPAHAGVMLSFNRDTSEFSTYAAFKAEIEARAEQSIIPAITDYIFGIDEATVLKKIKSVTGIYLFVDYGALTVNVDQVNRHTTEFQLAITVAKPIDPENMDFAEEVLLGDQLLAHIQTIRDKMLADQREVPWVKDLTFPQEITPVFIRELANSVGWTMMFRKTGIGIL